MIDVDHAGSRPGSASARAAPRRGERADWPGRRWRAQAPAAQRPVAGSSSRWQAWPPHVLLALATPIGPAVARGIADFSAVAHRQSRKAGILERAACVRRRERPLVGHSGGTELRELIRTNVDGKYVLSGFRSGTSLCLQLNGPTRRERLPSRHACRPRVEGGEGEGFEYSHASAEVLVRYRRGRRAAGGRPTRSTAIIAHLVGGNSYLWIRARAQLGESCRADLGDRQPRALDRRSGAALSVLHRCAAAPGDARRADARGEDHPAPDDRLVRTAREARHDSGTSRTGAAERPLAVDARLFKPDPSSNIVVGIGDDWCMVLNHGSGCGDREHFFARGPLNWMLSGSGASDQSMAVGGAAADGVARIEVFLTAGGRQPVPLKDNMFAALIPNRFPVKLVAYDARGRVVGIQTFPSHGFAANLLAPPAARKTSGRLTRSEGRTARPRC